jgi:hypothetical protein
MIACLDDDAAAAAMGLEARRVFDAKYDSGVMVARYLDLYQGGAGAPVPGAA